MHGEHSFPDSFDTERFQARRYRAADAPALLQLLDHNRERLIRNFPELAKGVTTVEEAVACLDGIDRQWDEGTAFVYGIWSQCAAAPIGQLRIKNIVWHVPSGELSYFVDREWLRKGVATETIRAMLREAVEIRGFRRVYVRIIAANEESLALARRLKLQHEGVHRNAFRCGFGKLHDVHLFAITDAEYRSAALRWPHRPENDAEAQTPAPARQLTGGDP